LKSIKPNHALLTQKEAVEIWTPLYDRMIALFLETMVENIPCRLYAPDWAKRTQALLQLYAELRTKHTLCGKPDRPKEYFAQVLGFLRRCSAEPGALSPLELGRLRVILQRYLAKRGPPDCLECRRQRERQLQDVAGPMHRDIATIVAARLAKHPGGEGLDDINHVIAPIASHEAATSGIPAQTSIPPSICTKVERCRNETVTVLIERGLITSGESLARVLPQIVAELRALGISDPALRKLYAATYRAFRRRRSLLLLDLASQVKIEELPWVQAIEQFRQHGAAEREIAKQALQDFTTLTLAAFPHALLPNKLLQELRALIKSAAVELPLVDELAADIFMGEFSDKFLASAQLAAQLLEQSVYATYYGIDYAQIRRIRPRNKEEQRLLGRLAKPRRDEFGELCVVRAGVGAGNRSPASNGMIIEQQQILTTQNLAALFLKLDLRSVLAGQLDTMAKKCFAWICSRHQMKIAGGHAQSILVKNSAYAWRQMIFFLSMLDAGEIPNFISWSQQYLAAQPEPFRSRFQPALQGLVLACKGRTPDPHGPPATRAQRFLGWSITEHWLLCDEAQ
jgi:hypothetical protein